jgi:hypothetical protein
MPKPSRQQYEALGQMLASIYETGFIGRGRMLWASFLRELASGLGGVLGATMLIVLLIWILSLLSNVPLVGRAVENIINTIRAAQP